MGATNRGMSRGYCGPKVLTPADIHTQESERVNRLRSNRSESLRQSGLSIGPLHEFARFGRSAEQVKGVSNLLGPSAWQLRRRSSGWLFSSSCCRVSGSSPGGMARAKSSLIACAASGRSAIASLRQGGLSPDLGGSRNRGKHRNEARAKNTSCLPLMADQPSSKA
jgi:hypothetical protein